VKHNVFVFPCGSEIGLEVLKALRYSTHFNVIGGSSVDDHGRFVFEHHIDGIPFVDHPAFVEEINELIDNHKIDFIVPTHDNVILRLAREKARGNLRCDLITSPLETCEIATSKLKTYRTLAGIIPVPKVYDTVDALSVEDLPVFMKPEVGNGSRGTQRACTIEEIQFYLKRDPSLLILENLPGREYTIDCFTDRKGDLLFCEGRQRTRISNGISVNSETVKDDRFDKVAQTINRHLAFRGGWFFQLKERNSGELVLMEIATRIAGTSGLARCKGVNLTLLSLFDALGYDIDVLENPNDIVIDRALQNAYKHNITYNHVYLDFDDLVVFEGRVNPHVMAFVYQCLNNNVKVHLITRHADDLDKTLREYRLKDLFDEIIWLRNKEDEKSDHIRHKDAIFIDDSFPERKKVHDRRGIPTFDAHGIEALMEKW
jgi:hypothetical protein